MVRTLIAQGTLFPLGFEFVRGGLMSDLIPPGDGEPAPTEDESSSLKNSLSPDWLERYGDFLVEEGYPEMARRTWRLCELHGPMPSSVREKLRNKEDRRG